MSRLVPDGKHPTVKGTVRASGKDRGTGGQAGRLSALHWVVREGGDFSCDLERPFQTYLLGFIILGTPLPGGGWAYRNQKAKAILFLLHRECPAWVLHTIGAKSMRTERY